ncbi:hypothetical protein [Nocardia sp. CA-120079]|uniref:hypothetical protein n=1 Tax=Nocardia sp. CA-120079 TaxID=3239974 RepID=UPI003D979B89
MRIGEVNSRSRLTRRPTCGWLTAMSPAAPLRIAAVADLHMRDAVAGRFRPDSCD